MIDLMFVLWAIIAFSAILLILAFGLIFAQKKLVAQGDVKIIINGDESKPILVKPGSSLLSTLSSEKIFLVS
ncbi:MAG TPA: hypothetical protein PLV12_09600 [Saprospiraceae bacterium]|nr:hypothetical protein [Saprospiraceae bacterium]